MRRSFVTVAGVLVFMAGFLAAIGMPSSSSAKPAVQAAPPRQITIKVAVEGMGPVQRRAEKRGTVRLEVRTPGWQGPVCGRLRWHIGGPNPGVEDLIPSGWNIGFFFCCSSIN